MGIIDVWRELHFATSDYTHYSGAFKVYARLDYFFMFDPDRFKIRECDILARNLSEHSTVSLTLHMNRKKRNTIWKFNSCILNDPAMESKIKENFNEFLEINLR